MQQDSETASGFPCGMFVTPPPDHLKCSICMDVFRNPVQIWDPVQICGCKHTYCRGCITQWKTNSTSCPLCRGPFGMEEPARDKGDEILELEVQCPHGPGPSSQPATSCGWTGPLKDNEAHVAVCPFAEISCPFAEAGCPFRAARRDMGVHSSDMGAHSHIIMACAAVKAECAAVKAELVGVKANNLVMERDINSLQRYVFILQASGGYGLGVFSHFPCY
jgi:hypothetical protein